MRLFRAFPIIIIIISLLQSRRKVKKGCIEINDNRIGDICQ